MDRFHPVIPPPLDPFPNPLQPNNPIPSNPPIQSPLPQAHHVDEGLVNGVDQREVVHEEKVRMESEEQWSVDHEEVGTRVAEMFEGRMFGGTIDRVLL